MRQKIIILSLLIGLGVGIFESIFINFTHLSYYNKSYFYLIFLSILPSIHFFFVALISRNGQLSDSSFSKNQIFYFILSFLGFYFGFSFFQSMGRLGEPLSVIIESLIFIIPFGFLFSFSTLFLIAGITTLVLGLIVPFGIAYLLTNDIDIQRIRMKYIFYFIIISFIEQYGVLGFILFE